MVNRMSRSGNYSEVMPNPTPEDFAMMRQKVADLEARLGGRRSESWHGLIRSVSRSPGSNLTATPNRNAAFAAAIFIDAEVWKDAQMRAPKLNVPVPQEITSTIGVSILDIQDVVERYFANVHTWLPFISRKRMQLALSNPGVELTFDWALFLPSMKLITQIPQNGPRVPSHQLYRRTLGPCNITAVLEFLLPTYGCCPSQMKLTRDPRNPRDMSYQCEKQSVGTVTDHIGKGCNSSHVRERITFKLFASDIVGRTKANKEGNALRRVNMRTRHARMFNYQRSCGPRHSA